MNNYQQRKEAARQKAIAWQVDFAERSMSYEELAESQTSLSGSEGAMDY